LSFAGEGYNAPVTPRDHVRTPEIPEGATGATEERNAQWRRREHLRTLEAIVYQGWDVPTEVWKEIPQSLLDIVRNPQSATRDRIRASEAISHLIAQRTDAAVELDRIMRLASGEATDRVQVLASLSDDQMAAVAASLSQRRA